MPIRDETSLLPDPDGWGSGTDDSDEDKSSLVEHEPSGSEDEADDICSFCSLSKLPVRIPDDVFGSFLLVCVKFQAGKGNCRHATFSVLLMLFTVFIQAAFSFAMIPAICEDEVSEKVKPSSQYNEFFNRLGEEYLDRVCEGKEWTWQESVIDDYSKYANRVEAKLLMFLGRNTSKGLVFGTIALLLWTASWVKAMREWTRYMLFITAYDKNGSYEKFDPKCKVFHPQNWERKYALKVSIAVTAVIRLIILVGLGVYGAKFLCHTDNLKDFILNSVALVFVIEVPALVQAAFASSAEQKDIERYNGQDDRQKPHYFVWHVLALVRVGLGVSFVFFAYWKWLKPFSKQLERDVYMRLCNASYT